jgi:hypothetical protein
LMIPLCHSPSYDILDELPGKSTLPFPLGCSLLVLI